MRTSHSRRLPDADYDTLRRAEQAREALETDHLRRYHLLVHLR